jgi:spore coat assembly protein SafA
MSKISSLETGGVKTTAQAQTKKPAPKTKAKGRTGRPLKSEFSVGRGRALREFAKPKAQKQGHYTVVRGDTLWDIARRNGVSLHDLIAANPQIENPDLIYPGNQINIPGGGRPSHGGGGGPGGVDGSGGVDGPGPVPTGKDPGTREGRINEAMAYFQSKGWSRAQAAGIVANLTYESGGQLNPHQQQFGGGPGFGLAQWEGPRQADFRKVMGKDIHKSTFQDQLEFVQWELKHTESAAGDALKKTNSPKAAADAFLFKYERAGVPAAAEREKLANQIYQSAPRGTSTVGSSGPSGASGSKVVDIAKSFLERNASELKRSGQLPMDPSVPSDVCCANFVSAVLQKAGVLDRHTNLVSGSSKTGMGDPNSIGYILKQRGWKVVDAAHAKPGDVAILNGGHHVELVASANNGRVTLIGSNNRNADGSQRVTMSSPDSTTWYLQPA